jgi:DNA (cytosine-5)-methyltransferase 1
MKHGSLFSGIGGFDLSAEWMGWENVFHCEWNEFGKRVLKYYWPDAESFHDITKTDFKKYYGTIDIISGGFPCQPYSMAGKRLGKEDERHLWPEMLRAIREISPRWVVGENVRGLINWNGGLVFDEVCADLENLGYQVAPYLIPASAVNAPHKRERIWFVAYRQSSRTSSSINQRRESQPQNGSKIWDRLGTNGKIGNASHADRDGLEQRDGKHEIDPSKSGINAFENFPTQSPLCGGNDGFPTELDGFTFSKWRAESIKAYGNAVLPQVVYQIFKAIEKNENL